jgi:superfamily II DNA or RNA helicase
MVKLIQNNNKTIIENADSYVLNLLDSYLRYPSEIALAKEKGYFFGENSELGEMVWDGWVRFLHITKMNSWVLTGLINYVIYILKYHKIIFEIEDNRSRPLDNLPEMVNIPLRDYQREAANKATLAGRGVLDMPPRSGKTRIACEIQRKLNRDTLWIAPTKGILKQTKGVLDYYFWDRYSCVFTGTPNKELYKTKVLLCTPNTAYKLKDDFFKSRDCIIVDEFHHSASSMYNQIFKMCDHIYYRFGMTGTFFRSGNDIMGLHAHLSNTIYKIDSKFLMDNGFIVPTYVSFIPIFDKLRVKQGSFHTSHGKYGIAEHSQRNQLIIYSVMSLYNTGRSVLVLINTKKQGLLLLDLLKNYNIESEYVDGNTPSPIVKSALDRFIRKDIRILIGTSVLGEGIDIPTADSLVYAVGQKAEVSLVQNAYRIGTAVDGKTHSILIDFSDRHHKRLLEHSLERARIYYKESTFKVSVLDDINQLPNWLSNFPYKDY